MNSYPINLHGKNIDLATQIFAKNLSTECVWASWYITDNAVIFTQLPWKDGRKPSDLSLSELKLFSAQQNGLVNSAIAETQKELANG